jgi:hypothetical protein
MPTPEAGALNMIAVLHAQAAHRHARQEAAGVMAAAI